MALWGVPDVELALKPNGNGTRPDVYPQLRADGQNLGPACYPLHAILLVRCRLQKCVTCQVKADVLGDADAGCSFEDQVLTTLEVRQGICAKQIGALLCVFGRKAVLCLEADMVIVR